MSTSTRLTESEIEEDQKWRDAEQEAQLTASRELQDENSTIQDAWVRDGETIEPSDADKVFDEHLLHHLGQQERSS